MGDAYVEKLKDPRWQKKRLKILERDDWTCQACSSSEKTLHVHHKVYLPSKEPWDIPENLLITLCEDCHDKEKEEMTASINVLIQTVKEKWLSGDVLDFAFAINNLECDRNPQDLIRALAEFFRARDTINMFIDHFLGDWQDPVMLMTDRKTLEKFKEYTEQAKTEDPKAHQG